MFKGSITALITPFLENGEIDWKAFDDFVEWQIDQGSHGLVPCGTTGESPTLSHSEHRDVTKRCAEIANGRVPVIAGTGSNSTTEAIELTQHAKTDGADAALIVTPYYNKPTQDGLLAHYKAIHDAVDLPIVIYNIPGRSVINMSDEAMAELAKLKNIIGVKDAAGDLARPVRTRLMCGDGFCQLSGDDDTVGAFLGQGGHGIISVLANVAPRLSADLHEAWQVGDIARFGSIRDQLAPLAQALFVETSPAPVKYAVSTMGKCLNTLRLPMVPVCKETEAAVNAAMKEAGVL